MESDKVAASRAMQQNNKMKQEIEELQKELVNLINSKVTYFGTVHRFRAQFKCPVIKISKSLRNSYPFSNILLENNQM